MLVLAVSLVGTASSPAGAQAPTPPQQPGLNQPGGPGPCSVSPTSSSPAANPLSAFARVWVFEPGGSASPTLTGGSCNDSQRPVLFVTHGYPYDPSVGCIDVTPDGFQLVDNMVSNGYIVVFANYACYPAVWWDVDAGFQHGVTMTSREDVSRIGIWGHSWGGVMVSDLAKAAGDRGWGATALWLGIFAALDPDNPADLPDNARVLEVVYEGDAIVANSDSAILFNKFTDIPANHKLRHRQERLPGREPLPSRPRGRPLHPLAAGRMVASRLLRHLPQRPRLLDLRPQQQLLHHGRPHLHGDLERCRSRDTGARHEQSLTPGLGAPDLDA